MVNSNKNFRTASELNTAQRQALAEYSEKRNLKLRNAWKYAKFHILLGGGLFLLLLLYASRTDMMNNSSAAGVVALFVFLFFLNIVIYGHRIGLTGWVWSMYAQGKIIRKHATPDQTQAFKRTDRKVWLVFGVVLVGLLLFIYLTYQSQQNQLAEEKAWEQKILEERSKFTQ